MGGLQGGHINQKHYIQLEILNIETHQIQKDVVQVVFQSQVVHSFLNLIQFIHPYLKYLKENHGSQNIQIYLTLVQRMYIVNSNVRDLVNKKFQLVFKHFIINQNNPNFYYFIYLILKFHGGSLDLKMVKYVIQSLI